MDNEKDLKIENEEETTKEEIIKEENTNETDDKVEENVSENVEEEKLQSETNPINEETLNEKKETFYHETVKNEGKKRKSKSNSFNRLIAACLVVSIAGGGSIGAGYSIMQNILQNKSGITSNETINNSNSKVTTAKTVSVSSDDAVSVIKSVKPSVVSINTITQKSTTYYGSFPIPYEAEGAGSGVIFYEDDTKVAIATNYHVIEGATNISVSIEGAESDVLANVAGYDSNSDLAVITVNKEDLSKVGIDSVTVATFGDSDQLQAGQSVIAIGNALGEGISTSGGMISATEKTIAVDDVSLDVIQTDAAINPGNSGGALVDLNGNVIGINTAKSFEEAVEGMGYAIPSNTVIPIINQLLTEGSVPRPFLGITGTDVTNSLSDLYGLPVGVLVTEVVAGGSADSAGIQSGDIITDFAGQKIMSMDTLVEVLAEQEVGSQVEVRVIRNGDKAVTLTLTIFDGNSDNSSNTKPTNSNSLLIPNNR